MTESILEEAQRIVHGDRQDFYGAPLDNHGCTASLWTAYLRRKYGQFPTLDPEDVCWCNMLQKIARQAHAPKRDNITDIAGYAANVEMIQDERARRGRLQS